MEGGEGWFSGGKVDEVFLDKVMNGLNIFFSRPEFSFMNVDEMTRA